MSMSATEKDPANHLRPAKTGSQVPEPGVQELIQMLPAGRIGGVAGKIE